MPEWVQWAVNLLSVTAIGIIGYFIKRTFSQNDERARESEKRQREATEAVIARVEQTRRDLVEQVAQLKTEWAERIDKNGLDIEKVETRLNEIIKDIPRMYVQKEDWLLSNQNIDRKLDKIMEILINNSRGRASE